VTVKEKEEAAVEDKSSDELEQENASDETKEKAEETIAVEDQDTDQKDATDKEEKAKDTE
jgi:hypothetical protein